LRWAVAAWSRHVVATYGQVCAIAVLAALYLFELRQRDPLDEMVHTSNIGRSPRPKQRADSRSQFNCHLPIISAGGQMAGLICPVASIFRLIKRSVTALIILGRDGYWILYGKPALISSISSRIFETRRRPSDARRYSLCLRAGATSARWVIRPSAIGSYSIWRFERRLPIQVLQ
jgi:hypothetical protein